MPQALPRLAPRLVALVTPLLLQAPAWAEATTSITIVKEPGKAMDTLNPVVQALIQFGIGALIIAVLVFMVNAILMKGLRVNPLTSSRFAVIAGLLLIYSLFALLFTPVMVGPGKFLMYLVIGVLAIASVFTLVARKA